MFSHESRGMTRNDVQASTRPSFSPPARADHKRERGRPRVTSKLLAIYQPGATGLPLMYRKNRYSIEISRESEMARSYV